jgi:hypothetical protein
MSTSTENIVTSNWGQDIPDEWPIRRPHGSTARYAVIRTAGGRRGWHLFAARLDKEHGTPVALSNESAPTLLLSSGLFTNSVLGDATGSAAWTAWARLALRRSPTFLPPARSAQPLCAHRVL